MKRETREDIIAAKLLKENNLDSAIHHYLRYIAIDTTATFTVADVKGSVDVDIDPFVYTLSLGYKF